MLFKKMCKFEELRGLYLERIIDMFVFLTKEFVVKLKTIATVSSSYGHRLSSGQFSSGYKRLFPSTRDRNTAL